MKGGTYLEPDKTTLAVFFERWIDHIKAHVSRLGRTSATPKLPAKI